MIATVIISTVLGLAFVAIIANEIYKKKKGRSSCSCGGNCGACGLCHSHNHEQQPHT